MTSSGLLCHRASLHHRRHVNSGRRRRYRASSTPLLSWKFDDAEDAAQPAGGVLLSSRKLAADHWRRRFNEISAADGPCDRLLPKLESSLPYPNPVVEKKTKGDRRRSKASDGAYCVFSHHTSTSVVSTLQAQLLQARQRIHELEAIKQSLRKKVKHLLNKLEEGRISWQRRERLKHYEAADELRDKLIRERKSHQRMEILNTKLINQLATVKLSTEQLMQGYEEEKKSRELLEDVCDKLAKQIGEDKAEVKRLKREYIEVREELEEERKMLQLAEVRLEEWVQMKMVDAKLVLEDKYSKMNMLITDLGTLLGSASCSLDEVDLRKAEKILQAAAELLRFQDIMEEFSYVPSKSSDLFSILKEMQQYEGIEWEFGHCNSHSRDSLDPEMEMHKINGLNANHLLTYLNCLSDQNCASEEDADVCDAASHAEYQSSSHSLEWCNSSLKKANQKKKALRNRTECNEDAGPCSPSTAGSDVLVSVEKSKQNVSSGPKVGKSKPSDGIYKIVFNEGDKRLSNGAISCVESASPGRRLGEGELRHRRRWIPVGLANPHIARGMKGCLEWPRAIQKNALKSKVSEAISESHESQLHLFLNRRLK